MWDKSGTNKKKIRRKEEEESLAAAAIVPTTPREALEPDAPPPRVSDAPPPDDDVNVVSELDQLYDDLLAIAGHTGPHIPHYWLPAMAQMQIQTWLDLGLTADQVREIARACRANHRTKPTGPRAWQRAMIDTAQLQAAPVSRPPEVETANDRFIRLINEVKI